MGNMTDSTPHSRPFLSERLIQFATVGALSTVIDVAVLNLAEYAGLNDYLSTALGFMAGLTNGYLLNSRFVFRHGRTSGNALKYAVVNGIGLGLTELIVFILHGRLGLHLNPAKLMAVAVVFFWNYGMSRAWAFRAQPA